MPVTDAIKSDGMSAVITAKVLECNQCGFTWIQRKKGPLPARCASHKCKSIAWNQAKRKKTNRGRKRKDAKQPKGGKPGKRSKNKRK